MTTLTLIRGLPGSGKSTLAQHLCSELNEQGLESKHYEADMYFVDELEQYHFDPAKLTQAHQWCQDKAFKALKNGVDVFVSNTFIERWEMKPYLSIAKRLNCRIDIVECNGQYQSIHNVPAETIKKMKKRWQSAPSI